MTYLFHKNICRVCFVCGLYAVGLFADATALAADHETASMDTIVVTGDPLLQGFRTGDVDTTATPAFFSVIGRDEFEGRLESLAGIIAKEVGVQVRQAGGPGSFSTVSLRGASSEQVKIFIDGIPLNDAAGGSVDLGNIALADVDRIEIYRGTTPINFAGASIGGAINIRTLRSSRAAHGNVKIAHASFGTNSVSGFISHTPKNLEYVLSAERIDSRNEFPFENDKGTHYNSLDDFRDIRNNNQFSRNNAFAKLAYHWNDATRIEGAFQNFTKQQGLSSWNNSPATTATFYTQRRISDIRLTRDKAFSRPVNLTAHIYNKADDERYDDRLSDIGIGAQYFNYLTNLSGIESYGEYIGITHTLGGVFALQSEDYRQRNLLRDANRVDARRDTLTLALQESLLFAHETLVVTGGARFFRYADNISNGGSNTRTTDNINAQLGAKYRFAEWLRFKANIANYIRQPSFFELFGDRGFFLGNDKLVAEKGVNTDIGFEVDKKLQTPFKRVVWKSAVFSNGISDIISRVYDAQGVGRAVNIASARVYGIESFLALHLPKRMRFFFNTTWQDATNHSTIAVFDGKQLPGRFRFSNISRFELWHAPVNIFVEHVFEGGMYYDTANNLPAEDKNQINIGASAVFASLALRLKISNITNDRHEDFNGYPTPGRSMALTTQFQF